MPSVNPVNNLPLQGGNVQAAIARAAERTGVDFDYLLAQARLESGLDPDAEARTSSATGLYQFIDSTWLRTLDRHGDKHGFGWAGDAISPGGRVADSGMRAQLLALRYDPDASSLMAAELARDNGIGLTQALGRRPEPAELYLAHFLGLGGAQKFLGAHAADPAQSAVALMPQAAGANRPIFYAGNRPRSVGEVMGVIRDKVDAALSGGGGAVPTSVAAEYRILAAAAPSRGGSLSPAPAGAPAARPSMAATLKATFGDGESVGQRASARIDAAYGKFQAFGL